MNVGVSVKNYMIGVLVKMTICGILAHVTVNAIKHVKLMSVKILFFLEDVCMYNPLASNMISYGEKTVNILLITGMIIIK